MGTAIYDMYRDWKNKKPKEKIIKEQWEQIPNNNLFENDNFGDIEEHREEEGLNSEKNQKVTIRPESSLKKEKMTLTKIKKNKKLKRVVPVDGTKMKDKNSLGNNNGGAGLGEVNEIQVNPKNQKGGVKSKNDGNSKFTLE